METPDGTIDDKVAKEPLLGRMFCSSGTATDIKLSYLFGFVLGVTGRASYQLIPAIPPVADLLWGRLPTIKRITCHAAYGAGVLTAYTDKAYTAIADIASKI